MFTLFKLKIFDSLFKHFSVGSLYANNIMWESKIRQKDKVLLIKQAKFVKLYFQRAEVDGDWKPLESDDSLVVYVIHVGGFSLVTLGQMFKPLKPLLKLALVIRKVSSLSWECSTTEKNHLRKWVWKAQKGKNNPQTFFMAAYLSWWDFHFKYKMV